MLSANLRSYIDSLPAGYLGQYGGSIDTINQKNDYGGTLLHYASGNGNFEMVQELVNIERYDMITPLWLTVHNGYFEIVHFLIKQGSDVNSCNNDNEFPLHVASMNGDITRIT